MSKPKKAAYLASLAVAVVGTVILVIVLPFVVRTQVAAVPVFLVIMGGVILFVGIKAGEIVHDALEREGDGNDNIDDLQA
jgi:hypothetical protein